MRMVSAFLALALTFCSFSAVVLARSAMPPEAYDDAVAELQKEGVIDGYSAGNPRLYDYVNRAEALKVILMNQASMAPEVSAIARSMPPVSLFSDVEQTAWYAPYIEIGFKHQLIKGYSDGRFWPEAGVRVSEAVSMLMRSYGVQASTQEFRTSKDLPNASGEWYAGYVSALIAKGGVMPGSELRVGDYLTRGQLFDMVYRMRIASGQVGMVSPQIPRPSATSSSSASWTAPQTAVSSSQYLSSKPFSLSIPSLNILDLTITHPTDPSTQKGILSVLKDGVGHLFGYPGDGGKVLIYGHSSGYPWDLSAFTKIFRGINKVELGQKVYVTYGGKVHTYQVTEKRTVPAKDHSAFEPDDNGEELILYTCWPPDSISHRFLVIAKPVESVAGR